MGLSESGAHIVFQTDSTAVQVGGGGRHRKKDGDREEGKKVKERDKFRGKNAKYL